MLKQDGGPPLTIHEASPPGSIATVLIVPGLGDHGGRHLTTRRMLLANGIATCTVDLRGHGTSGGRKRYVERFEDFEHDLQRALDYAASAAREEPLFVLGHSMGALVTARLLATRRYELAGVILSGGAFQVETSVSPALIRVGRLLSRWWPGFRLPTGINYEGLTRDEAMREQTRQDPHVTGWVSARLGAELLDAIEGSLSHAAHITHPLLLVHGESDPITTVAGSAAFYERANATDKTLLLYPGCRHELHRELPPDRERFFDDVVTWIRTRASGEVAQTD